MLRITISRSGEAASAYFNEALSKEGNYYLDKKIDARWEGETSVLLGLKGEKVTKESFSNLVNNIDPQSKERLTVRNAHNRKSGFDLTYSTPKSISLLHAITGDEAILEAHRHAYKQAMKEVEGSIQTQANTQGKRFYTNTQNIIYAAFDHFTSRPNEIAIDGEKKYVPDPQMHTHCYVPNVTWNAKKKRFQAVEMGNIHRLAPYYETVYHSHLSSQLNKIGYHSVRTHDRYEIAGISREILERYSNRTKNIEKVAHEKSITDDKAKSKLGALTRHSKGKAVKEIELIKYWKERLSASELKELHELKGKKQNIDRPISVSQAINRSLEYHLERNSTAQTKRILATALKYGYGSFLPKDAERELNSRKDILRADINTIEYITTKHMVRSENQLIELATTSKGKFVPINKNYKPKSKILNEEQRNAIKQILGSNDGVQILKGLAGTGKTTTLSVLKEGITAGKKSHLAVAISTQAVNVLKNKGFDAHTVASLLHEKNKALQNKIKNGVLIIDEGSLIGVQDMSKLLDLSSKNSARTLISGDTRQHSSILAGDAMRILEEKAELKTATIKTIIRQKPNEYKKAVQKIATGKTLDGFNALDKIGAIEEIPDVDKRVEMIAKDYVSSITNKRSALIISPTHNEGQLIADKVREELKAKRKITGRERIFETLKNLSFTEAEKKDIANYTQGQVVRFVKNQLNGFKAGALYEVVQNKTSNEVIVRHTVTGQKYKLPHATPQHFQVYQKTQTTIAKGDLIRLTNNSKTIENSKIANGTRHEVAGFTKAGDIKLKNGKTLSKDVGHFTQGIVETSYSSQGKDAMDVFIAQSEISYPASSQEQFYVSVSRGTHSVKIYTSDKSELKKYINRSGERMTAREVTDKDKLRIFRHKQRIEQKTINEKIRKHGRLQHREKLPKRDISK